MLKSISLIPLFLPYFAHANDFCNDLKKEFIHKLQEKVSSGVPIVLISSFFDRDDHVICEENLKIKYNLWTEKYDISLSRNNESFNLTEFQKRFCELIGCEIIIKDAYKYRLFFNPITKERLLKIQQVLSEKNKNFFSLSPDVPNYEQTLKTALIQISLKDMQ